MVRSLLETHINGDEVLERIAVYNDVCYKVSTKVPVIKIPDYSV